MKILPFLIPLVICAVLCLLLVLWLVVRNRKLAAAETPEARKIRRHKRHSAHHFRRYSKRNPTVGETGGLPPAKPLNAK